MTKRDRIVLGVLAAVAVVAGFYLAVLKPTSTELNDLDEQVTQAETRRANALAQLSSASTAREQYKRDQSTLAVLGKAVPADDGTPSLLYQLHKAARSAGVDFDDITVGGAGSGSSTSGTTDGTPGATQGPSGLEQLPLQITFQGDFFKLDKFLRALHRFASIGDEKVDVRGRLLTVDAVELTPSEDGLPKLQAKVTANAYVAPKSTGGGTASATSTSTATATSGSTSTDAAATPSTTTSGAN